MSANLEADLADKVRKLNEATNTASHWRSQRDATLRKMRAAGYTTRKLAALAGISHHAVQKAVGEA